jgi:hypothetical protein
MSIIQMIDDSQRQRHYHWHVHLSAELVLPANSTEAICRLSVVLILKQHCYQFTERIEEILCFSGSA